MGNKKDKFTEEDKKALVKRSKKFANATYKSYKKENKDIFDSKKEAKHGYIQYLIDLLPDTIMYLIKYGHIQQEEIQERKKAIYNKLTTIEFVEAVYKEIKNDIKIKNIKLLPIIIKDMLREIQARNDAAIAANPNAKAEDTEYLVKLAQLILKKRIKKAVKAGIPEGMAFDILCIIPNEEALENSQFYRIHSLYDYLYERAKSNDIPFEAIIDLVSSEDTVAPFVLFALLERKEKFTKLTDAQKKLYLTISNWCFKTMDKNLERDVLEELLRVYVNSRKKDDGQGKDSNRRYALASLAENDYPRIVKVVQSMIAKDGTVSKYLN